MLNLLLSLPEANLLTFLFLLDHLKRYPALPRRGALCAPGSLRLLGTWGSSPPLGTRATATFFPLTSRPLCTPP